MQEIGNIAHPEVLATTCTQLGLLSVADVCTDAHMPMYHKRKDIKVKGMENEKGKKQGMGKKVVIEKCSAKREDATENHFHVQWSQRIKVKFNIIKQDE